MDETLLNLLVAVVFEDKRHSQLLAAHEDVLDTDTLGLNLADAVLDAVGVSEDKSTIDGPDGFCRDWWYDEYFHLPNDKAAIRKWLMTTAEDRSNANSPSAPHTD